MKKYIGISLVILVFGIIFIPKILERIKNKEVVEADRLNIQGEKEYDDAEELAYLEINGESKKAPDFKFVNQHGDTITNQDYKGKVYLVEFFFTTCTTICPVMHKNLLEIEKEFENNEDFGIVSISIDPEHDTPKVLTEYAENYGIDNPNWNFLTGDKQKIYALANQGFNIYAGEDKNVPGGFAHQGMFALVDKNGFLRSRKDQFGNVILFYRGSLERNISVAEGGQKPQIDILIEDIKKIL
ncbi:SCO family protein [Gramella sp. AN32]|uniref:SCO family protein n=1 Tax=Christiangramia antarctica TaxID=2058158 RepID=A0ABW5XAW6_9FLAO|nr:SCO family protein [Gramella sp. AN32]MCM4155311.1 SCO family protein [Gramella sp. AN32]